MEEYCIECASSLRNNKAALQHDRRHVKDDGDGSRASLPVPMRSTMAKDHAYRKLQAQLQQFEPGL